MRLMPKSSRTVVYGERSDRKNGASGGCRSKRGLIARRSVARPHARDQMDIELAEAEVRPWNVARKPRED